MARRSSRAAVESLLEQLDEAYDRQSWHGTNLRGSLRGLTVDQALWRPAPGRLIADLERQHLISAVVM